MDLRRADATGPEADAGRPKRTQGAAITALLLAGGCFSLTLFFNLGYQSGAGFTLAGLGVLALAFAGWRLGRGDGSASGIEAGLVAWLAVATALFVSHEWWSGFLRSSPHDWQPATTKWLVLVGFLAVVAGAWRDPRWLQWARPAAFGIAFLLGATWTIDQTPDPAIDVWHMHAGAAERLLDLRNPYELSIPNPYRVGEIDFYAYPPTTLLLQTPFHALAGDVRYASVVALALASFCVRRLAGLGGLPAYAADAAGALVLVQGRPFFMVEQGWTEPVVVGLVALGALAWLRRPALGIVVLALALASKQFLWLFIPLLPLLPGMDRRLVLRAAIALAVVHLPFLLWDPARFWHGVVMTHLDGSAVNIAYPGVERGEPWPGSNTVAVNLDEQYGMDWPLWAGIVGWLAAAGLYAASPRRTVGVLLVCTAAAVGLLGYLGSPFHPNYIWLLPVLALVGLTAELASRAAVQPAPVPQAGGPASPV